MIRYSLRKTQTKACVIISLLLTLALSLGGCSSDSYDTPKTADNAPVAGAATSVLIEPVTLKGWMDQGLVNSGSTFDTNVVILDFGGYTMDEEKDPMRIKGACRVPKADLDSARIEGVALAYPLVATGPQMDAVIQRLGIDENTTIVFTTDPSMSRGSMFYATRAYWMFRYWGFPKDQLKLLNGGNTAFSAEYSGLMTRTAPEPTPSSYSVKNLPGGLNDDLRLSIGEMLTFVSTFDSDTDVLLDARGSSYYSGTNSSTGYVTGNVDYVVYDGHPKGGQYLSQGELFNSDKTFKTKAEIEALFASKGWSTEKVTTVYCLSGYSATPLYFAVEAILGGQARLYDGSWSQFGQYSDYAAQKGELTESVWASDQYLAADEGYRYNWDYLQNQDTPLTKTVPYVIESLKLDEDAIAAQPSPFTGDNPEDDSDVVQSQVEAADAAYVGTTATVTFPEPNATATTEVLINETTLQSWMDADLVNAAIGTERVVILDVTDTASFIEGHIPGAQLWDIAQHVETRVEGPAPAVNMVLSGAKMDEMIQKHGIDENTTIVITSSQANNFYPSRAYFLFRYYGFPKERLKVLNGYNNAWSGSLTISSPVITRSTLSVKQIANIQLDTRVSLAELMDATRDGRGTAIDMRGDKSSAHSTTGVFNDIPGDWVVFEGTLLGGKAYAFGQFSNTDKTFKDATTIANEMASAGIDTTLFSNDGSYSNPVYSYCRTAYIASTGFFVLDAILGIDVMTYDGSWSQWGKMSSDATKGGELPEGSQWATDNTTYMSVVNYNAGETTREIGIESLEPDEDLMAELLPSDPEANQVEEEDSLYRVPAAGDSGSSPVTPFIPTGGGC